MTVSTTTECPKIIAVKGIRWVRLDPRLQQSPGETFACCEFGHVRVTRSELTNEWVVTRADIVKSDGHVSAEEAMTTAARLVRETAEAKILHAETRLTEARQSAKEVGVEVEE